MILQYPPNTGSIKDFFSKKNIENIVKKFKYITNFDVFKPFLQIFQHLSSWKSLSCFQWYIVFAHFTPSSNHSGFSMSTLLFFILPTVVRISQSSDKSASTRMILCLRSSAEPERTFWQNLENHFHWIWEGFSKASTSSTKWFKNMLIRSLVLGPLPQVVWWGCIRSGQAIANVQWYMYPCKLTWCILEWGTHCFGWETLFHEVSSESPSHSGVMNGYQAKQDSEKVLCHIPAPG